MLPDCLAGPSSFESTTIRADTQQRQRCPFLHQTSFALSHKMYVCTRSLKMDKNFENITCPTTNLPGPFSPPPPFSASTTRPLISFFFCLPCYHRHHHPPRCRPQLRHVRVRALRRRRLLRPGPGRLRRPRPGHRHGGAVQAAGQERRHRDVLFRRRRRDVHRRVRRNRARQQQQ